MRIMTYAERKVSAPIDYGLMKLFILCGRADKVFSLVSFLEKCGIYYDIRINDDAEPVPDIDMNDYDLSRFTYK